MFSSVTLPLSIVSKSKCSNIVRNAENTRGTSDASIVEKERQIISLFSYKFLFLETIRDSEGVN